MQKPEAMAILGIASGASAKDVEEAYLKRSRALRWRHQTAATATVRLRCERDLWKVEQARRCLLPLAQSTAGKPDEGSSPVLPTDHKGSEPGEVISSISRQWRAGAIFAGRFELQFQLDRGGPGVVWLALEHGPERPVDLRFLPDRVNHDPVALRELKEETGRSSKLDHPSIARVYDLVEEGGSVAIATEYVEGWTLSQLRLARPNQIFEVDDLKRWIGDLCNALEYVHQKAGLLHGELSPVNLMMNVDGRLKVTNFSVMRRITDLAFVSGSVRGMGGMLTYRSPQQVLGERPAPTDDIYAVGATLYELLTGRAPFGAETVLAQVIEKVPPSMVVRRSELGVKGDPIPDQWEKAIADCLAKNPAQRPQSPLEVLRRVGLAPALPSEAKPPASTAAVSVSPGPDTAKNGRTGRRRRPLTMAIIATSALVLIPLSLYVRRIIDRHPPVTPTKPAASSTAPDAHLAVEVSPGKTTPNAETSPTQFGQTTLGDTPEINSRPSVTPSETPSNESEAVSRAEPVAKGQMEATRAEVLKRLEALPGANPREKEQLIERMQSARFMERLSVLRFPVGQTALHGATLNALLNSFNDPQLRARLSNPTLILVLAGYADVGGDANTNMRVSQERAENVSKILTQRLKLLNIVKAVGMGGTAILDSQRPDQNRAVEIWVVEP